MVRRQYDIKCKILRELESKGQGSQRIEKTRAVVKVLHSRIRVAIQRIDSISRRIEELRDKELQQQLEELIEGYVLYCLMHLHNLLNMGFLVFLFLLDGDYHQVTGVICACPCG